MAAFAALIKAGKVKDTVSPKGDPIPLFVRGNIPNHGVLGRAGAAGYLRRVTTELGVRGLETAAAASATEHMQASSDLFKVLRYEVDLTKAGAVLEQIAAHEVAALADMTKAWADVKLITERAPMANPMAAE
jgi:ribosomal protein S30